MGLPPPSLTPSSLMHRVQAWAYHRLREDKTEPNAGHVYESVRKGRGEGREVANHPAGAEQSSVISGGDERGGKWQTTRQGQGSVISGGDERGIGEWICGTHILRGGIRHAFYSVLMPPLLPLSDLLPTLLPLLDLRTPHPHTYPSLKVVRSILDDIGQDELLGVLEECFVRVGKGGGGFG